MKKALVSLLLFGLSFLGISYYLDRTDPIKIKWKDCQLAQLPDVTPTEEKPLVILVMSYNNAAYAKRNIESILSQNYHNYRVIYIDDASTDDTYQIVSDLTQNHRDRVTLIHNAKNRGGMANHWHAVQSCRDEEIMVVVDGDDFLAHPDVLARLNHYYDNPDVWMTYSQHIEYPDCRQGICSKPLLKRVFSDKTIREQPWSTSHLRTFYVGLFKKIKLNDLMYDGQFFTATYDFGCMFPMIEMAKEHAFHIPEILYVYNLGNPLSDSRVHREQQNFYDRYIRALPRYETLKEKPLHPSSEEKKSDLIVFSYNRPLQLYAFLESSEKHLKGLEKTFVIYRASNERFLKAYDKVKERFPNISFHLQPEAFATAAFKPMLMELLTSSRYATSPYVLFAVDDIIVKDDVDLPLCIETLSATSAYAFYLRLGTKIDYCYMENSFQGIPKLLPVANGIFAWQFYTGKGDWNYPNSVDMTLFRRDRVIANLSHLHFTNPANLEGQWAQKSNHKDVGLCFQDAKIVNLPLNVVSSTFENRHMHWLTADELLETFEAGYKMDIEKLHGIDNCSAHMEYEPTFIPLR